MTQEMFDSHFHIIDPRFPLVTNEGYLPPAFVVEDYLVAIASLGVTGGVVVSGSFQGFDQEYLLTALASLGPEFVGVTNLPAEISDAELEDLAGAGVRAVRFNMYRGASGAADDLLRAASRVAAVAGMHSELYVDARDLHDLESVLSKLPRVSVDHLGISDTNRDVLLRLVEGGLKVKATGFGRVSLDVVETLQAIHTVDPSALMFGTDLPSTRARRPFDAADVSLIVEALGEDALAAVLRDNARDFYRMEGK